MVVRYTLPQQGAVIVRNFLRQNMLPSTHVEGAYVCTETLRSDDLSVLVCLHVQVREYEQLFATYTWNIKPLPPHEKGAADFLLTPLPQDAVTGFVKMKLRKLYPQAQEKLIDFVPCQKTKVSLAHIPSRRAREAFGRVRA